MSQILIERARSIDQKRPAGRRTRPARPLSSDRFPVRLRPRPSAMICISRHDSQTDRIPLAALQIGSFPPLPAEPYGVEVEGRDELGIPEAACATKWPLALMPHNAVFGGKSERGIRSI